MKKIILAGLILLLAGAAAFAQPQRVAAGLSFSTKKRFNGGDTGNPGLNLKTWVSLDRKKTMHLVPSVTAYNPLVVNHTVYKTKTYLLHGDLDYQILAYHDGSLRLVGIAGVNYKYIVSKNELIVSIPDLPVDSTIYAIGPNIGAGLEMKVSEYWDFMLTGKYSFPGLRMGDRTIGEKFLTAPLSGLVLEVHGVYYFNSRGKGYSRY